MKASEAKLIRIIEGTNQYLVPHFQRPYTWQRKNWDALWADLEALVPLSDSPSEGTVDGGGQDHFMGAIVTAPAHSVPEGVTKYLLIDGQQRLTTLLLLLAAIRDRAHQLEDTKLASKINDQEFAVQTWQDVLRLTLSNICTLGNDVISQAADELPRYLARDASAMRTPRELEGGLFCESHLNAQQIHRICSQVAQLAGLSSEEWRVDTT